MNKTLMVVDGNSLMHRAFYALPILTNASGEYTNAVFGFFSMLINAIAAHQPEYLAIAFDKKGKTFRHTMYDDYKAGRKETPEELRPQFGLLKDILGKIGIVSLELESYEADDILGVLSKRAQIEGINTILLTGDKDALQLVSDHCRVMLTRKGVSETEIYDTEKLQEIYQLTPAQMIDLKAMMGDSSDNIPGVPGVGEKTALKLLQAYHDLDGVYTHIDEIKGKLKERLTDNKELAYMSRKLAVIDTDAPLDAEIDLLAFGGLQNEQTVSALKANGFKSLIKRLGAEAEVEKAPPETVEADSITTMDELQMILGEALGQPLVAISFNEIISISFAGDKQYDIHAEHTLLNLDFSREAVLAAMKPMLEDEDVPKILHGAKQCITMLKEYGIVLRGVLFDTKLAEYALDPSEASFELCDLAEKYGYEGRACAMVKMYPRQKKALENNGLWYVYNDIEVPLTNVLIDMEERGFRLDLEALAEDEAALAAKIDALSHAIYELSGYDDFNINSTKQLGQVLFERIGLPAGKKTRTGYSTDIEVLEKLEDKHPVIGKIIDYRRITKLKSTYIDGLKAIAGSDGFVHTTFMQISTVTGRISSKEPNLQNIPIRTEEGKRIRRLFLPSTDNRKLVAADYSQIELRILASISGDEVMKSAFSSGHDIHARTAAEVFDVPQDKVTPDMRRGAKAVNFGIVYGISNFGLARNLGISVGSAGNYISRYLLRFSGVRSYMEEIKERAKRDGYVTTLLGRRRYLPELKSPNYNVRSFGERAALNTPIQGTAADIIKLAMIDVSKKLDEGGYKARLILQVHDELIVDTPEEEVIAVSRLLKECMECAYTLDVPLVADVAVGRNWMDAK